MYCIFQNEMIVMCKMKIYGNIGNLQDTENWGDSTQKTFLEKLAKERNPEKKWRKKTTSNKLILSYKWNLNRQLNSPNCPEYLHYLLHRIAVYDLLFLNNVFFYHRILFCNSCLSLKSIFKWVVYADENDIFLISFFLSVLFLHKA